MGSKIWILSIHISKFNQISFLEIDFYLMIIFLEKLLLLPYTKLKKVRIEPRFWFTRLIFANFIKLFYYKGIFLWL